MQNRLVLPMKSPHCRPVTQTSLLGNFASPPKAWPIFLPGDVERPANTAIFLRRYPTDPLRRFGADSAFLQTACLATAAAAPSEDPSSLGRLPFRRPDSGSPLRDDRRPATDQQDRHPPIQRNLPFPPRAGLLSRPIDAAALSQTSLPRLHPPTGGSPRSAALPIVLRAVGPNQFDLRPRFGGVDRLRQATVCPYRLQPQEERASILPTILCSASRPRSRNSGMDRSARAIQAPTAVPSRFCAAV